MKKRRKEEEEGYLNGKVEEPASSVQVETAAQRVHVDARALAPHFPGLGHFLERLPEHPKLSLLALGLVELDQNGPESPRARVNLKCLFALWWVTTRKEKK